MKIYNPEKQKPFLKEAFLKLEPFGEAEVSLIAVDDQGVEVACLARIGSYGIKFPEYARHRLTGNDYILNTAFDESGALQAVPWQINQQSEQEL